MSSLKHFLFRDCRNLIPLFIAAAILYGGCSHHDPSPSGADIRNKIPDQTLFFGHKGNGPIDKHDNPGIHENSWKSVARAMEFIDGSEIDIQMSKDSTLWLFHDHTIPNCKKDTLPFAALCDSTITSISHCKFDSSLIKLRDFGELLRNQTSFSEKTISLDLKVLMNPHHFPAADTLGFIRHVAKSISRELRDVSYLVEIPASIPHKLAKKTFKTIIYKVIYRPDDEDVRQAKSNNYGLSLPFDHQPAALSSFENIQLWTPNTASGMFQAFEARPKIIQSDHLELARFFKRVQRSDSLIFQELLSQRTFELDKEYTNFIDRAPLPEQPLLLKISSDSNVFTKKQHFVLAAYDKADKQIFWESIEAPTNHPYFFLEPALLKRKGAVRYSIYFWNPEKGKTASNLRITGFSLNRE